MNTSIFILWCLDNTKDCLLFVFAFILVFLFSAVMFARALYKCLVVLYCIVLYHPRGCKDSDMWRYVFSVFFLHILHMICTLKCQDLTNSDFPACVTKKKEVCLKLWLCRSACDVCSITPNSVSQCESRPRPNPLTRSVHNNWSLVSWV